MESTPESDPTVVSAVAPPDPARYDVLRQWVVAISAVVGVAVAFLGSGAVVGTPVNKVANGAFSTDATLVAPASRAFSIWAVIYTGLVVLAVFQFMPSRRSDPRQRRVGWLVTASLLINAAWVTFVQFEWVGASVILIVALLGVLVVALVRLNQSSPSSRLEAVVVDGTMGLYLGWVCIATVANTAAALVHAGVDAESRSATTWAVAVLVVAGGVGVVLAVGLKGRLAPAIALAWGLIWVAVARTSGQPQSAAVAATAVLAAVVTLGSALVVRSRSRRTVSLD